jgi:hypothetical protein
MFERGCLSGDPLLSLFSGSTGLALQKGVNLQMICLLSFHAIYIERQLCLTK